MRDYRFLIAFEEAGIWEELALASDGSLPRVDRSRDQPVCYSLALTPKVTDWLQVRQSTPEAKPSTSKTIRVIPKSYSVFQDLTIGKPLSTDSCS